MGSPTARAVTLLDSADVPPDAVSGTGLETHIGGQTAAKSDLADRISDRLPWLIVAVVTMSCLLLLVGFRSLVIPLKAAAMNIVSIGAAYGVVVAVFQWGWGASAIGLDGPVAIESYVPMLMFAVLFGLSMDYEVFLLTSVQETFRATGDNAATVRRGLADTGRLITSAALIMVAVFGGFVLTDDPLVKIFGVGLSTAIIVDATIVRCLLVPALMVLLGRANWYLPPALAQVLPRLHVEGDPAVLDALAHRNTPPLPAAAAATVTAGPHR